MSGAVAPRRVHLPSLAAELPGDWTVSERAIFRSPSGTEVHVQLDPATGYSSSGELLGVRLEDLRRDLGDLTDVAESEAVLRHRRTAPRVDFGFRRDGVASSARLVCAVEDGLAMTAVVLTSSNDERSAADFDEVLGGLRIVRRAVPAATSDDHVDRQTARSEQPDADTVDWSGPRAAWADDASAIVDAGPGSRWSAEELAVIATVLGAHRFPTVDAEVLEGRPDEIADAVVDTVLRSLLARGVLDLDEEGRALFAEELSAPMELAVQPDLAVTVERVGRDGVGSWWIGVSPTSAVQVTVLPNGLREITALDVGSLVGRLGALAGLDEPPVKGLDQEPVTVSLSEVVDGTCAISHVVRVCTGWNADGLVQGSELIWAAASDGNLLTGERVGVGDELAWRFEPTDVPGLRSELLDALPGS